MLCCIYTEGDDKTAYSLLSKCSFVMIKYPRKRKGQSLPHERVFKMDFENLVCKDESFIAQFIIVYS